MQITVKQFILSIVASLLALTYIVFSLYFFHQREQTAQVILKTITNDMYSLSYTLSKDLEKKTHSKIASLRPILDRTVVDNDFIETILIMKDQETLLTTDPFYNKELLNKVEITTSDSGYKVLHTRNYLEEEISFYEENKRYTYRLVFVIDKNEVARYFAEYKVDFFLFLILAPVILLGVVFIVLKYFLGIPLEKLRQLAYYQRDIPSAFRLRELEIVRHSMVQTFARLEKEKKDLYLMSRTDELSGLANRNALEEYLGHLIENSKRNKLEFAFLFLDLDNFKSVNDSLGHNVGDELLKNVANIINDVIRDNDFVARVGGDEFIIVIQEYVSLLELTNIIKRIQEQLSQTIVVLTHPVNVESSIGVALYPHNGTDIISLMKHSDIAMYEAKQNGKAQYHFFTEELNTRVQNVIQLDNDMRLALTNNEYELYYQPKVDVATGKVFGVEALIRWHQPHKGLVRPDSFIPLAEENGFIVELGDWILEEAIKQSETWMKQGIELKISINVSTKQFLASAFTKRLRELLQQYNVDAKQIDLEITEYLLFEYNEKNTKILNEIHNTGVSISLDDFGTGYSSLTYLKKFPIDNLKIDKAFMDDFNTSDGAVFIQTIVKMGQTLGLKIIAEGIESEEQVEYLKSIGCDEYQGYYYSKPLEAKDIAVEV